MSFGKRNLFLVFMDSLFVLSAILLGYKFVFWHFSIVTNVQLLVSAVVFLLSYFGFAMHFKLYKKAWAYASVGELIAIVKTVTIAIIVTAAVQLLAFQYVDARVLIIAGMFHILFVGGLRFLGRIYRDSYLKKINSDQNTLVIGAGAAGTMVVRQLLNNPDRELNPVGFIDDDPQKYQLQILGVPVIGKTDEIVKVAEAYNIRHIVIAIPSLSKQSLQSIIDECAKTNAKTQIMPMIEDIMLGKVSVNAFKDVKIDDLLGRDPVELEIDSISEYVTNKVVLVTGAGGSIGSEICRQISRFKPQKLLLLGHGENSIYQIDMELRNQYAHQFEIIPIIADIQDRDRICEVMNEYRPDVVYHAAAHKHVPLMEYNPYESVKNNIFGTKNVAEAADRYGVSTFVMVSTDKAVNPPNVMGATKRVAEMIVQNLDKESKTKFVAVRFGNVLGSRGSVIPLFKKQIQAGGPVTVTHPDMTRYFMTIPEASRLVIQAGCLARGGEIFVLDMGEPVRIVDLAKNLIQLSGYSIDEIGIRFSGLRPGEKMYEELLGENEIHPEQIFSKIHIGKASPMNRSELYDLIHSLENMTPKELKETLVGVANTKFNVEENVS